MLNINTVLIIFDIVIAILGVFLIIRRSMIVGWFGELWTKQALKKLPKDQYKVLNDVLLKNGEEHARLTISWFRHMESL